MDSLREPLNRIVPGGEGDSEVRASPSMEGSPTKKEVDEEGPPEGLHEGDMERWVEMVQNASSYTPLSSFLETFDGLKGFFSVVLLVLPPLLATWMRTSGNDIIPEWLVLYSFISFALAGPTIFILYVQTMYRCFVVRELLKRRVIVIPRYISPTIYLVVFLEIILCIFPIFIGFVLWQYSTLSNSTLASIFLQSVTPFFSLINKFKDTGSSSIDYSGIFAEPENAEVALRVIPTCARVTIYGVNRILFFFVSAQKSTLPFMDVAILFLNWRRPQSFFNHMYDRSSTSCPAWCAPHLMGPLQIPHS